MCELCYLSAPSRTKIGDKQGTFPLLEFFHILNKFRSNGGSRLSEWKDYKFQDCALEKHQCYYPVSEQGLCSVKGRAMPD